MPVVSYAVACPDCGGLKERAMPIIVACRCGRKFQVKDEYAGKQARCPACASVLLIPGPAPELEQGEEERYGSEPSAEEQQDAAAADAAEEARRVRQQKAAKDARVRRRNNIIAIGSVGIMVLIAAFMCLGRGGGDTDKSSTPPDPKPNVTDNTPPPPPKPVIDTTDKALPPPPGGQMDDVDRFVQWAIQTRDSALKANALVFKPGDPRLQFEANWRKPTPELQAAFKTKTNVLASILDVEYGPKPSAATDPIEARMLMDPDLVGTCICSGTVGQKSIIYVFLEPCKTTIADVAKKYGPPTGDPLPSSNTKIYFYGRIALVEGEGGKVHAVMRRNPKE
jgi:hypothetical protein